MTENPMLNGDSATLIEACSLPWLLLHKQSEFKSVGAGLQQFEQLYII